MRNLFLISLALFSVSYSQTCVPLHRPCKEDCNCCNHHNDTAIRCEERALGRGRKCVYSKNIGRSCAHNSECKSQYCDEKSKVCKYSRKVLRKPKKCYLRHFESNNVGGNMETKFPKENCRCEGYDPLTTGYPNYFEDEEYPKPYVFDTSLETWKTEDAYVIYYPEFNGPIQEIKFCNSRDCPECDPTCYKLEAYCEKDGKMVFIQEGPLNFTDRGQCITLKVPSRPHYSRYKISLPCRAAPELKCPALTGDCACETMQPFEIDPPYLCFDYLCMTKNELFRYCHRYESNGAPMELMYMGKSKVGDFTEIVYKVIIKENHAYGNFYLSWGGACCIHSIEQYEDVIDSGTEGSGTLTPNDKLVDVHSPLFNYHQCKRGLKIPFEGRYQGPDAFLKLKIRGDVIMTLQKYTLTLFNYVSYSRSYYIVDGFQNSVMSPNCACDANTLTPCQNHPIKLDELGLYANCNQIKEVHNPYPDYDDADDYFDYGYYDNY